MARALLTHNLPILISFIFLLFIVVSSGISDVSNESFVFLPSPNSINDGDRSTMFLPLFPPKETSRPRDEQLSRRHLQKSPSSARMPLHDDLLLNGYYSTRLWIGTPPQRFALIVDTGSTVTYVPCSTCEQCGNHQVMKELHSLRVIEGPDPNYKDICFSGAGSDISELSKSFPPIDMVFSNGKKLSLTPENYLFRHSKVRGAYCLGIFQNGKDPTTLLGGIVVRNTLVTYDRENERIGFWKTNCSEIWDRLNLSPSPPPLPSGLDNTNSSANLTPALAPSLPPEHYAPGKIKIGFVSFYMSLSVDYSELKPRVPELAHFIAQELEVNVSQVHLMNFSTEGNDSLIRWAIFPAGSSNYMPNATATEIINRLAENRFHLPDTFGSYKLVKWDIEPPPKRIRWQQNYLVVVVALLVVLIIGLSASMGWLIWRRRQETPYIPVGSVETHEKELQPLN